VREASGVGLGGAADDVKDEIFDADDERAGDERAETDRADD
jgi:hypothetical protein